MSEDQYDRAAELEADRTRLHAALGLDNEGAPADTLGLLEVLARRTGVSRARSNLDSDLYVTRSGSSFMYDVDGKRITRAEAEALLAGEEKKE